jgi:hypothetical protein
LVGATHELDGAGEELLLVRLPGFGGLSLAFELPEHLLSRALRVSRAFDAREQLDGLRLVPLAPHDVPPPLTSAGGASATGMSVGLVEAFGCRAGTAKSGEVVVRGLQGDDEGGADCFGGEGVCLVIGAGEVGDEPVGDERSALHRRVLGV